MAEFFAELKRRHMFRVAAAYAVVAWLLLQLVNNVAPALRLPDWAATFVLVLLVIGFPVALLFCWIQHLAPADGANAPKTAKLDWLLIGALVLVITLLSYQQFVPSPGTTSARQQASVGAGSSATQSGISIAVLPLANLSGDAAQEFFSDGMTDEITSALAKVRDLRVVGRSSAFQFKGQNRDLRAIGQALSARYLIDGSVRKVGTRVRITAQLIDAENGVNIWTENYDRELTDVFAIQDDIAQAIAVALRVPLGLQQGGALVRNRTNDLNAYDQYLRARAIIRARGGPTPLGDAVALLEQVVARDPEYAPAWGQLAFAYAYMPNFAPAYLNAPAAELQGVINAWLPKAEEAARRTIELDVDLADAYLALALVQNTRGKYLLAEELFSKALTLDPYNPDALGIYGNMLADLGNLKEALVKRQMSVAVEPLGLVYNINTAVVMWLNGQTDAAIAMLRATPPNPYRARRLAAVYAAAGRYEDAANALQESPSTDYVPGIVEEAVRLLRTAPTPAASPQTLPPLGVLDFVYIYAGATERALEHAERDVEAGLMSAFSVSKFWHPAYAPVRKIERFKALVRNAGMVDYWRAKGWPEFCGPTTGDDFACD